jgi:hypothetical protein
VVEAEIFSTSRNGQFWIVVLGQDVDCCGFGSWQQDLFCVPEEVPSGHATAGQIVAMLTSIRAIVHATADFIS